ncbi:MAG: DUF2125 domain-containing protein, partial [Pseudomonadota bacterium]
PIPALWAEANAPAEERVILYRSEGLSYTGNLGDKTAADMEGSIEAQTLQVQGLTADHPILNLLDITNTNVKFDLAESEEENTLSVTGTVDVLSGEYSYSFGEIGQSASADFSVDGMSMAFDSAGEFDRMVEDFETYLASGGGFDLVMAFGPSVGSSVTRSPELSMSVNGRSGRTDAVVSVSSDGAIYQTKYDGFDYSVEPLDGSLPIPPFSVSMAQGLIDLAMPTSQTEEAQEARIGFELVDVTADEGLWSLIDPEQVLPRDPATVEIGLRAEMMLNGPITQAIQRAAASPMAAGQVETVTLDKLILDIAGANVTAMGALEIDNTGFMPMPNGAVDVTLKGVTGLSQNLVALGLLDQMQAGMAMGMMMAFAKPGSGPDEFTSKIEFKNGGIYANGQQIQ